MATIDRERVHAIQLRAFRDFLHTMAGSSRGARVFEWDDLVASVVPVVPRRSIVNSVSYRDGATLARAYDDLAATYDVAGVEAWTVWTPEFDRETMELLERKGHQFDGEPAAMVLDLGELDEPDFGDLEWELTDSMPLMGELNDRAYGLEGADGYAPAFAALPPGTMRLYLARVDGEPASVVGTMDHDPVPGASGPDCGIYWVATPEEYRGRGLSGRLMRAALAEARERGCATSSLQASEMGEPVYLRLGYRSPFRWHLYEWRLADSRH